MRWKLRHEEEDLQQPARVRMETTKDACPSIDEVLALEEGTQVEYLPNTEYYECTEGEECKVLNPPIGRFCVGWNEKRQMWGILYTGGWGSAHDSCSGISSLAT